MARFPVIRALIEKSYADLPASMGKPLLHRQAPCLLRASRSKACTRACVSGLTFHDLRGAAVVRLALAEAAVPQIRPSMGTALKDVEAILDARYLGRDIQLAEAAVLKLEKRTKL